MTLILSPKPRLTISKNEFHTEHNFDILYKPTHNANELISMPTISQMRVAIDVLTAELGVVSDLRKNAKKCLVTAELERLTALKQDKQAEAEAKQAELDRLNELKQAEAKQAEVKQAEAKQAELDRLNEIKQTEAKQVEAKQTEDSVITALYYMVATLFTQRDQADILKETELMDYMSTNKEGYEQIRGECKPYFDFDPTYNTEADRAKNEFDDINNAIIDVMNFTGAERGELAVLTALGKKKDQYINSIHIIANNDTSYPDGLTQMKAMEAYQADIQNPRFKSNPDMKVYKQAGKSQLFRLPFSTKHGENRPFIVVDSVPTNGRFPVLIDSIENYTDERHDELPERFSDMFSVMSALLVSTGKQREFGVIPTPEPEVAEAETEAPETDDQIQTKYMALFTQQMPDEAKSHTVRSIEQNNLSIVINLNRVSPSHCVYCNRIHESDHTAYLLIFKTTNACFFGCIRQKGRDCNMICIGGDEKKSAVERLNTDLKTAILKIPAVLKQIKYAFGSLTSNNGSQMVECDTAYCADIPELMDTMINQKHNIVAVRSGMNTGKTYANKKAVEQLLKINPKARIMVISMRISLAEKYKEDYKGFECYLDKKGKLLTYDRQIVQLDTLGKVRWSSKDRADGSVCDMVVLDEADQAIKHMTASTYMNNPCVGANIDAFRHLVGGAKQVVLMSANLTHTDIERIQTIRESSKSFKGDNKEDSVIVFTNKHEGVKRTVSVSLHDADVINDVKQLLTDGKRGCIAINHRVEKALALKDQFLLSHPKAQILVICKNTLKQDDVQQALKNPNVEWAKYDLVIISPSVQGGVSYDISYTDSNGEQKFTKPFDKVYGMFHNLTNASADACQMLRRVRSPTNDEMLISITNHNAYNGFVARNDLIEHIQANREDAFGRMRNAFNKQDEPNEYGMRELKQDAYFNMYVDIKITENKDRRAWRKNFITHQLLYGNNVVCEAPLTKEEQLKHAEIVKATNAELKGVEEVRAVKHANDLNDATNINTDRKKEIKKKMEERPNEVSDDEELQYKKAVMNSIYRMDEPAQGMEWYKQLDSSNLMKWYRNLHIHFEANRSFEEALEVLQESEIKREQDMRTKLVNEEEQIREKNSTTEAIIKSLTKNYNYSKHKIILNWLSELGFNRLDSDTVLTAQELKDNLHALHIEEFENPDEVFKVLGKDKRKAQALKKLKVEDAMFVKKMLLFINGSLKAEFGVSIKSVDTNQKHYYLSNKHIEAGVFKNPRKEQTVLLFDDFTPLLGKCTDNDNERVVEERADTDAMLKELHGMRG